MSITIEIGDITGQTSNAIVNAANTHLLAGGGVCGAIHRAAGPELEAACKALTPCPTGFAVITPGFRLPAKYVIHTVGPRWYGGNRGEPDLLKSCYLSIFRLVRAHGIKSISIPAISTGIYQYPLEQATQIAVATAREEEADIPATAITFMCFDQETFEIYRRISGA